MARTRTRKGSRKGVHSGSQSSIPHLLLNSFKGGVRRSTNESNARIIEAFQGFSADQRINMIITSKERPDTMSFKDYKSLQKAIEIADRLGPIREVVPIVKPIPEPVSKDEGRRSGPRLDRHPKVKYGPRFKVIYGDPKSKNNGQ